MATMPIITVKMTEQMSNTELAEAISTAYSRAGDAGDVQQAHKKQMNALLEIQLARAAALRVAEDSANTVRTCGEPAAGAP